LRASYFAKKEKASSTAVDILMRRSRQEPGGSFDRDAFVESELSKGRTLLDGLAATTAGIKTVDPKLFAMEEEAQRSRT